MAELKYFISKIELNKVIKLLDDSEAKRGPDKEGGPLVKLTVRDAMRMALTNSYVDESPQNPNATPIDSDTKFIRFVLARRIYEADVKGVEIKGDKEIQQIKSCVGKMWAPEVVGYIFELLDKAKTV